MGLLDRVTEAANRWQLRTLVKELQGIRKVLEVGVDSYRLTNGLDPVFDRIEGVTADERPLPDGVKRGSILRAGEFQLVWFIEELARERHVPLTPDTDLELLALDMGWVSPEGKLLVFPESAKGLEVEGSWIP